MQHTCSVSFAFDFPFVGSGAVCPNLVGGGRRVAGATERDDAAHYAAVKFSRGLLILKNCWLRCVVVAALVWTLTATSSGTMAASLSAQEAREQKVDPPTAQPSLPVAAAPQPFNVHQLARAVDDHYNHLRSLEADFTEIYRGEGAERQESGTLWLKKPRKMRWEYRSPRAKLFISDGQSVWFYMPAEKQVRKSDLHALDDVRSPIAFLLGKTKLEKELQGLSKAVDQTPQNAGDTVLRGVPRGKSEISEVQLEITPAHQIARIVLISPDGGSTEFDFTGWKENVELTDSQFHFSAPPGVEVLEGAFGP